jgi:Family of unknown function (DUF5681)
MSDYEVGYGKPPKQHQFKKGQSGHLKGRPRGSRNLKTDLAEELGMRVTIREGGRTRKISVQQAALKRLLTKALNGDLRAIEKLFELKLRLLPEDAPEGEPPVSADEAEILDLYAEEIRRQHVSAEPAPEPDGSGPARPQP